MSKRILVKNLRGGDLVYGKKYEGQIEVWKFKGYEFERVAKVDIYKVKIDEERVDGGINLKEGEIGGSIPKLTDKDKRELKKVIKRIKIANSLEDEKTKTKSR